MLSTFLHYILLMPLKLAVTVIIRPIKLISTSEQDKNLTEKGRYLEGSSRTYTHPEKRVTIKG